MSAPAKAQNNAEFVSQSVPGGLVANQSYAVSITMRNNGSNPWTVGDYYLRSQNPQDNLNWGTNRVELPNAVAPGENVTFNFSITPALSAWSNFQWRMAQGTTNFGASTTNLFLNVSGTNNAAFVSQSVPEIIVPGQVYAVSVTMQNTGNTTWSEANAFRLYSENPAWNLTWGVNRAYLPATVVPGASATFNFNVTAPSTPGVYNFQWKMIREGVTSFGALTPNIQVAVGNVNNAQFVSQSVPGGLVANQSYAVSITMRNNGSNPWTVGDYYLRSQNPQDNTKWGLNRVELPNAVAPGENVTFNFNVTPRVNGWTNFQWRMAQGATSFGAYTTNLFLNLGGTNNAAFVSQSVPEIMTPGQVYAVSVTMQNTGTTTWGEEYGYRLYSENPAWNLTWGVNRAYLPGTVVPGASVTFNFNVTAPSTPGVYNFQWKMIRENVTSFGALTPNVAVAVNGTNDSQFISQTVPGTMSPAQGYPVSVTLQNTGTSTWAPGSYFLGSENPQANTTWGLNRVELAAPVAPGANVTLNFNVTAPSTAGTYNFQWRMVQNSTRFGAFTTNVSVNIQQAQAMTLYYVHADHLNTPRLVANAAGATVWRWDQTEPFGVNVPDENPSGLGTFEYPGRMPGQYFDKETNLNYNYFRHYDSGIGRYIQSDPQGIADGPSTFAYAWSDPLTGIDPTGLSVFKIIKLCKDGYIILRNTDFKGAVRASRKGQDVLAPTSQKANQVANAVHGGAAKPVKNPAHGPGMMPHYHPTPRTGGHVFYRAAAALTITNYVSCTDCVAGYLAEVGDFINPLSAPKDVMDIFGLGDD